MTTIHLLLKINKLLTKNGFDTETPPEEYPNDFLEFEDSNGQTYDLSLDDDDDTIQISTVIELGNDGGDYITLHCNEIGYDDIDTNLIPRIKRFVAETHTTKKALNV